MAIRRSRFPAGFGALWGCVLLDLIGFGIVLPILPLWAERFGARPGTIGALLGTAAGSLLTGLASSLVLLFVGRAIDGMSGASVAVAQAAVADLAEPSERPRLLGLIGAAFGLGFVAGPALGALAALGGPRAPFLVAAALAACNAVVALARLPETHPRAARDAGPAGGAEAETTPAWRRAGVARLLLVAFTSLVAF